MNIIKRIFKKQEKKRKPTRGNTATRSKAKYVSMPRGVEFDFRSQTTKFELRPPSNFNRWRFKKYPTPFVWDNPNPKGELVCVRRFYPVEAKG